MTKVFALRAYETSELLIILTIEFDPIGCQDIPIFSLQNYQQIWERPGDVWSEMISTKIGH